MTTVGAKGLTQRRLRIIVVLWWWLLDTKITDTWNAAPRLAEYSTLLPASATLMLYRPTAMYNGSLPCCGTIQHWTDQTVPELPL